MTKSTPDTREVELRISLDEASDEAAVARALARALGTAPDALPPHHLVKRSLDARHGKARFLLRFLVGAPAPSALGEPLPVETRGPPRVAIVGTGPAGLFCAYALARAGVASVLLERGQPVQPRRKALRDVNQKGALDVESNYCFGEGGAGTYSDGKLYTRAHKRGDIRDVLETLVVHGASPRILVDARPHIGSNKLPKVIENLRARLLDCGVGFRFGARVDGILIDQGRTVGVRLASGEELLAEHVVWACGHSARDALRLAADAGAQLVLKPFAVGVRVEHPQPLIDRLRYRKNAGHPALPSAAYALKAQTDDGAVFSFCMCPGGFIVPAATERDGVVVNGMSPSQRNSKYANAGLVVSVSDDDVRRAGHLGPLGGVAFQRALERAAFDAGGGGFVAPAQRLTDFLERRVSRDLPACSYQPGLQAVALDEILDRGGLPIAAALRAGLSQFERRLPGFLTREAVLVGVETRTSAPVRILRDPESLHAVGVPGLYPAGEGAGYAGGIMSAALDGIRVARAIAGG